MVNPCGVCSHKPFFFLCERVIDIKEEWKSIKGYEGLYEVSNYGNVRSLDRYASNGRKIILYSGKVLSKNLGTNGYHSVQLSKDNQVNRKMIHRLVAEAFIPNPDELSQVNHIDENKLNNHVSNLEWCTAKYNTNYGGAIKRSSEKRKGKPLKSKWVKIMCVETGEVFDSVLMASRITNTNKSAISMVLNGKRNKAGGSSWVKI